MPQELPLFFVDLLFKKHDPEKFQERFLHALTRVQRVERGSIWVKQDDRYVCTEAIGDEADKVRGVSIDAALKSIVGDVIKSGKMIIAEPGKSIFFQGVERYLEKKNTQIMCFPLIHKDGTVYGAVEILDTTADSSRMNLEADYLELLEGLVAIVGIALGTSLALVDQKEQNLRMRKVIKEFQTQPYMVGQSEIFLKVRRTAEIYAANDFPVMITGESGTGKELVARDIHNLSSRRRKPFLVQNCSAIPDTLLESELFGYKKGAFTGANEDKVGLFAAADGGTLFLDEIGDMPVGLQGKILRFLQSSEVKPLGSTTTRRVDVRVIAATNRDLGKSIAEGIFREDLFYRLNVLPLRMPSIRERKDDIPILLTHFMNHFAQLSEKTPKKMSPEVLERLIGHHWPGNIRQMENLVKYLLTVASGDTIELADLPPLPAPENAPSTSFQGKADPERTRKEETEDGPGDPSAPDYSMEKMERNHILSLLEKTKWNVTAAAAMAGIKRTTFASRMKRLGISRRS